MRKKIKSGINFFLAMIFILLGIIGLALPIIPQTIFFVIAFIILSFEIPSFGNFIEKKLSKTPKILNIYHTHRVKFEKYFR